MGFELTLGSLRDFSSFRGEVPEGALQTGALQTVALELSLERRVKSGLDRYNRQ